MASEPVPPRKVLRYLGEKADLVVFAPSFSAVCNWWSGYLDASRLASPVSFSAWLEPRSGRSSNVAWPWHIAHIARVPGGLTRTMELSPEDDARCRQLMADLWIEYLNELGVPEE